MVRCDAGGTRRAGGGTPSQRLRRQRRAMPKRAPYQSSSDGTTPSSAAISRTVAGTYTRRRRRSTARSTLRTTTAGGMRRPRWRMGGVPGRLSSGVSMSNGNTTVSPIPSSASSARIASEYPATPNLAAEYAASPGQPCTAAVEARLTTWPPAARSHGSVVRIVLAVPTRSTRSTRSKSSGACAAQVPGPRIAAQLTRRSRRPLGATCCATTRSSAGRSATSATAVAIPALRAAAVSASPRASTSSRTRSFRAAASASAKQRPMPLPAPVISATRSCKGGRRPSFDVAEALEEPPHLRLVVLLVGHAAVAVARRREAHRVRGEVRRVERLLDDAPVQVVGQRHAEQVKRRRQHVGEAGRVEHGALAEGTAGGDQDAFEGVRAVVAAQRRRRHGAHQPVEVGPAVVARHGLDDQVGSARHVRARVHLLAQRDPRDEGRARVRIAERGELAGERAAQPLVVLARGDRALRLAARQVHPDATHRIVDGDRIGAGPFPRDGASRLAQRAQRTSEALGQATLEPQPPGQRQPPALEHAAERGRDARPAGAGPSSDFIAAAVWSYESGLAGPSSATASTGRTYVRRRSGSGKPETTTPFGTSHGG